MVQAVAKIVRPATISYVDDFSTLLLTFGLIAILVVAWRRLTRPTRLLALFSLGLLFAIPLIFNVVGHYAFYYSYLRFIPAMLVFLAVLSELAQRPEGMRRAAKVFSFAIVGGAM